MRHVTEHQPLVEAMEAGYHFRIRTKKREISASNYKGEAPPTSGAEAIAPLEVFPGVRAEHQGLLPGR